MGFHRVSAFALVLAAAPALAQPAAPNVSVAEDSRARRGVDRCLERVGQVPAAPNPDRAVDIAEGAERFCTGLSRRDPAVDEAALVAYQQAMLAWAQEQKAAAAGDRELAYALDRDFRQVAYVRISPNWIGPGDTARIERETQAALTTSRALAGRIAASGVEPPTLASFRSTTLAEAAQVPRALADMDASLERNVPVDAIMGGALVLQAKWQVAAMFLADEPSVREANAAIERWLGALAARGGAAAVRQEAVEARAAQVRMPAAQAQDAGLEATMRRTFESQGWNEPVQALRITSGWAEERNVAGQVTGRRRDAAIAVRLGDGSCRLYDFTFFAPRSGSSWGPLRRSSHASRPMACENVPR
ncbi:MAG: hypothetical protein AAGH15_25265 [Myxococcota bacterium]